MTRIEREKETVSHMIRIYCRYKEGNKTLCPNCQQLLAYAHKRLEGCKFGEHKPTCKRCPIHCYRPDMKQKIQEVMRYSGPRMLLFHPWAAIRHLWQEKKIRSQQ